MAETLRNLDRASLANTCQYIARTADRGDFLVQVAWPLCWSNTGVPPKDDMPAQTIFVVDGNAYFYTAVDITRRMEYLRRARTVVVGIGYPNDNAVYDYRRGPDLTPASEDGDYEMPLDRNGNPRTDISFGKALEFLQFLRNDVMTYVYETLLPVPRLAEGRKALFGHSYGGIFALYTLFTAPSLFDSFMIASPIMWWNKSFLTERLEVDFYKIQQSLQTVPSILLTWGFCQSDLVREERESEEAFAKRYASADDAKMKDAVLGLAKRLREHSKITTVVTHQFADEDHGSTSVTSLQMGIMKFLRYEL